MTAPTYYRTEWFYTRDGVPRKGTYETKKLTPMHATIRGREKAARTVPITVVSEPLPMAIVGDVIASTTGWNEAEAGYYYWHSQKRKDDQAAAALERARRAADVLSARISAATEDQFLETLAQALREYQKTGKLATSSTEGAPR